MTHWKLSFIVTLLASPAWAFDHMMIPFISDSPVASREFTRDEFEFVGKTLASARLAPHLRCELRAELRRELRKFSDGEKWIDLIEISFSTEAGLGGNKLHLKVPIESLYGRKTTTNKWSGVAEDYKIEVGDFYNHWLCFMHDGSGHIVFLQFGNNVRTLPCIVKD